MPQNINIKMINKAEVARLTGYSRQYVRQLLIGERKNSNALKKVIDAIKGRQ